MKRSGMVRTEVFSNRLNYHNALHLSWIVITVAFLDVLKHGLVWLFD